MLSHQHIKRGRPQKKEKLQTIDKLMYAVSFLYPLTVFPQLFKVYTTHNVESLALASWIMYVIFQTVCVLYAISRRLNPLIIEGSLWLIFYVLIVIAIFMYQ
jgi:uncharacterized protein with PQ loop repeat